MHAHLKPRLFGLAALAAFGLAACGGTEPAPDAPAVTAFEASEAEIETGSTVTLSWQTEHADAIAITYGEGLSVDVAPLDAAAGSVDVLLDEVATYTFTLTATGVEGTTPATAEVTVSVVAPPDPVVNAFSASPTTITAGDTVTLTWETTHAESVVITEDGGDEVLNTSVEANGTIDLTPTADTTYTLTATGKGGTTATATATVTVLQLPVVDGFTATSGGAAVTQPILSGTEVVLAWETTHVTEVTLTDSHGTSYTVTDVDGSLTVTPSVTTTYTLGVTASGGSDTAELTVDVLATVNAFTIASAESTGSNAVVRADDEVTLAWATEGATSLTLTGPDGFSYTTTDPAEMAAGTVTDTPASSGTYDLVLEPIGTFSSESVSVEVTNAPRIRTVSVDETSITEGEAVSLSWTADGAETILVTATSGELEPVSVDTSSVTPAGDTVVVTLPAAGDWTLTVEAGNSLTTKSHTKTVGVTAIPLATVDAFDVQPRRTVSGGELAVTWATSGSDAVRLTQDGVDVTGFPGDALSGTFTTTATQAGAYVLHVANPLGDEVASAPVQVTLGAPEIASFEAELDYIATDEPLTLSWEVVGGRTLTVSEGGADLYTTTAHADIAAGSTVVTTPAATGDYVYTLTVVDGDESTTQQLTVHVSDGPIIRDFYASSETVTEGAQVTFTAQVDADSAGVQPTLTLVDDTTADHSSALTYNEDSGLWEGTITLDTVGDRTFTLTASTEGTTEASASLTLTVAPLPAIVSFTATEALLDSASGPTSSDLTWETTGSTAVRIYEVGADGEAAGAAIFEGTEASTVATGAYTVSPSATTTYLLEAENLAGVTMEATTEIQVDLPLVTSFTATDADGNSGAEIDVKFGDSVTLSWETARATEAEISPTPHVWSRTYGTFQDISGNETATALSFGSYYGHAKVTFPEDFTFPFGEETMTEVKVAMDGFLGWGSYGTGSSFGSPDPIPDTSNPEGMVVAFWDYISYYGLDTTPYSSVVWDRVTDGTSDALVFQWTRMTHEKDDADFTFQVWLYANGDAEVRYADLWAENPAHASGAYSLVGLEYPSETDGIQIGLNRAIPGGLPHTGFVFPAAQPQTTGFAANDSVTVTPVDDDQEYELALTNDNGHATGTVVVHTWTDLAHAEPVFTLGGGEQVGDEVHLSWSVNGATDASVTLNGTALPGCTSEGARMASGSCTVTLDAPGTQNFVLQYANPVSSGTTAIAREVLTRLAVESFTANGATGEVVVGRGSDLTLAWDVTNAAVFALTDPSGADITPDTWSATTPDGQVVVPVDRAGYYRLFIGNDADWTRIAYADLWVTVSDTTVADFTTTKQQVYPGQDVVLTWSASSSSEDVQYTLVPGTHSSYGHVNPSIAADPATREIPLPRGTDQNLFPLDLSSVGFGFPFDGQLFKTFEISSNGWIGFGTGRPHGWDGNQHLPHDSNHEALLAAFWDDLLPYPLDPSQAHLYYRVTGLPGQRELVVEWNHFSLDASYSGEPFLGNLTFQAIIDEQGGMEIRYVDMTPDVVDDADQYAEAVERFAGGDASAGWTNADGTEGAELFYKTQVPDLVKAGARHVFYQPGVAANGSRTLRVWDTTTFQFCAVDSQYQECQEVTVDVVQPGDLVVTELMVTSSATDGDWVEIRNVSDRAVDIAGWTLADENGATLATVPAATPYSLDPGQYAVIAASADAVPATVSPIVAAGFALPDAAGSVALMDGPVAIDEVAWDDNWTLAADRSVALDPYLHPEGAVANDVFSDAGGPVWCAAADADTWGGASYGSPGYTGWGCRLSGYDLDYFGAPQPFIDLRQSPTAVRLTGAEQNDSTQQVEGGIGFPYTFYGVGYSELWVTSEGYLGFADQVYVDEYSDELPGEKSDEVIIAPFWSDIKVKLDPATGAALGRVHTDLQTIDGEQVRIVQWSDFTTEGYSDYDNTMTFQVQLWEHGDIVFAYETMDGEGSIDWKYATGGDDGSIGFESEDGALGIQYGYDEGGLVASGDSILFKKRP